MNPIQLLNDVVPEIMVLPILHWVEQPIAHQHLPQPQYAASTDYTIIR
jgi:hypothetical protein